MSWNGVGSHAYHKCHRHCWMFECAHGGSDVYWLIGSKGLLGYCYNLIASKDCSNQAHPLWSMVLIIIEFESCIIGRWGSMVPFANKFEWLT